MTLKEFKRMLKTYKHVGAYCGNGIVWVTKRSAIEWAKESVLLRYPNKVSFTNEAMFLGSSIGTEITP